ncbi:hypothetical protein MATL_G00232010 [Megalops atlanticus]|uniref:SH2 domain-containing protein n=1 Tax=Megalops atlanticus TaxID=7932 RepID=A0A9D3SY58_MEGAT|nr:hypothetical protein MATL_G00232010 [Megalops atlanticus]
MSGCSPTCNFSMDFDYQMIKDREMRQREAMLRSLPIPQPRQVTGLYVNQQPSASRVPPVKPRRSLKSRPPPREEVGPPSQPATSRESEGGVQKVSPAVSLSGTPVCLEPLSPSLRAHTLLWFQRTQLPRLSRPGHPLPLWLHGFATRREAEELLKDEEQGCFLVRLSESKIGFVLSYRGKDRCRHFIIEEEGGGAAAGGGNYLIAGEESRHGSLQELVSYYTQHAVGPFDEMLTTPCVKAKQGREDLVAQEAEVRDRADGVDGGPVVEQEPSAVPSAPPAPAATLFPPAGLVPPPTETAQYAVVRKLLKKSHSLPDNQTARDTASPDPEVPNFIPIPPPEAPAAEVSDAAGAVGEDAPEDVPYARVNKPPRAFSNTPPPSTDAPQAASPSHLSRRGSGGEQKYWELVPMHTYEEANHVAPRMESHDQIDFYAMGRRRDIGESAEASTHVYSEVESALQRLDGRLPLTPPSRPGFHLPACSERPLPDNHTSIYEQIPDRGSSVRPPLPPPNHRH